MLPDQNGKSNGVLVVDAVRQMADRFFYSTVATTRSGPHIRDANSVQRFWNYFVIASLPASLIGLWNLGHQINIAITDRQYGRNRAACRVNIRNRDTSDRRLYIFI